ncbi:ParB/RepB/Spo0J family partition protein [candidate division WOR-3 bacterium]|nr:ParB/RepB/Spo0J family partition protein [candidate division WOR-3 bacterium]
MQQNKYKIKEVDPILIKINPGNVRDENEEEIESDESFQRLKESVAEFGVLVPLVVRPYRRGNKQFILVDGERRLRAALATNQKTVPVHIVDKLKKDEVLYSFQIHMLRKEWTLTAQARALEKIIKDTEAEFGKQRGEDLFDIVQEKTGYSDNRLRDHFRVLRYIKVNRKILEDIDDAKTNLKFSHLVQLEASFVEQLEGMFPEVIKKYGLESIRRKLLDKVKLGIIGSTREPINKLLPLFLQATTKEKSEYLKKLIFNFLDDKNKSPDDLFRRFELKFPISKEDLVKLVGVAENKMEELESVMNNLKYAQFSIYRALKKKLIKKLDSLISTLKVTKKKLQKD